MYQASLVAQTVKNLPAMQEICVQSWVGNIPWEEGMATCSILLARRIPMDRGVWQAAVHGGEESDMTKHACE